MNIAIIGGGPSGLFILKKLLDLGMPDTEITIFEKEDRLGAGMPYSKLGACDEHITNVSGNEIPMLVRPVSKWIKTVHPDTLARFNISLDNFNDYKVLPRLLFGDYLADQFQALLALANRQGVLLNVQYNKKVMDIKDLPEENKIAVILNNEQQQIFEKVVVCTGHIWPKDHEEKEKGYFDSPYPPSKLKLKVNYPVAIRGASLTAIDAIRTLSRENGEYQRNADGKLTYHLHNDSTEFRLILHSLHGMLPAIRFHLEDSMLGKDTLYNTDEIKSIREKNDGFVPLDLVFEQKFKQPLAESDPNFYASIKSLSIEEFVEKIMTFRENIDAFTLFKAEYKQAEQSIKRRESVHWKEMLGSLSYTMNYPAKYFSAEDMMRLKKVLMPLISTVIAYVPQSSAEEIMALHAAKVLDLITVDKESSIESVPEGGIIYHYKDGEKQKAVPYQLFVDAMGQPPLPFEAFPYESLKDEEIVSPAKLKFSDTAKGEEELSRGNKDVLKDPNGGFYLKVPGVAINDHFQVLDTYQALNPRVYVMAVPLIGGYNPDYSGLDFCEQAATKIAISIGKMQYD